MDSDINLLNLDIRAIVPYYGRRPIGDGKWSKEDLGLFYMDNELKLIKIENGWPILRAASDSVWGKRILRIPLVNPGEPYIVEYLSHTVDRDNISRVPRDQFYRISRRFVGEHGLSRLESDIDSMADYLEQMKDSNDKLPDRDTCQDDKLHDAIVHSLMENPKKAAEILHLPEEPIGVYSEVRLNTRFSRCIQNQAGYIKYLTGNSTPNSCLARVDLIFRYSKERYYGIDIKTKLSPGGSKDQRGKKTLKSFWLWAQKNFHISPTLVVGRIEPEDGKIRAIAEHRIYKNGALKISDYFKEQTYSFKVKKS